MDGRKTVKIIDKWYRALGFPTAYDEAFYKALQELDISDALSIHTCQLDEKDGKRNLLSFLYLCEGLQKQYEEKGIDEEILCDTLQDLVTWTNTWTAIQGELYLGELAWLARHLGMRLFKLGRLQFCMGEMEEDIPEKGFHKGEPVLEIHIPQGEALTPAACKASVDTAREFFARYFPAFHYRCMTCHSWLLDDTLQGMLSPKSNILQFQALFEPVHKEASDAILRYVFTWDTTRDTLAQRPAGSGFAGRVKAHVLSDGRFFEVLGILRL